MFANCLGNGNENSTLGSKGGSLSSCSFCDNDDDITMNEISCFACHFHRHVVLLHIHVQCEYSVLSTQTHEFPSTQGKQARSVDIYIEHVHSVQTLLIRCPFTVLSNKKSQGSRGVTTVSLVYSAG